MKNKGLFIRRSIYLILFILSVIFISIRGGNLPYMLFFLMIVNAVFSYAHILYVFYTIKIFQTVSEIDIMKNETVSYHLSLSNEGKIAYGSIQLHFLKRLSEVSDQDKLGNIRLEPGQGMDFHAELLCRYSGIYYVGVDTIEIMDYFKIFCIRFPMPQKMRVTVKPRLIEPSHTAFLIEEDWGSKSSRSKSQYQIDNEVKRYVSGDNRKLIHWKNSAKRQELMVRNPAEEEISGYVLVLDANVRETDYEEKVIVCDKLRETVVALVYYIYRLGYYVQSVLDVSYEKEVCSGRDFDELYDRITKFGFEGQSDTGELLLRLNEEVREGVPFISISANPGGIAESIRDEIKVFRNLCIIDVNQLDMDALDFRDMIAAQEDV